MNSKKAELIANTKDQVVSICGQLAQHNSTIDTLMAPEGPVNSMEIQGHMEAHLEKIEDSIDDLCNEYNIPNNKINEFVNEENIKVNDNLQTQKQAMKFLKENIKNLEMRVKGLVSKKKKHQKSKVRGPLYDLSRKLNNDLCRTSYLLQ